MRRDDRRSRNGRGSFVREGLARGKFADADAGRVMDAIGDCGGGAREADFTDAAGHSLIARAHFRRSRCCASRMWYHDSAPVAKSWQPSMGINRHSVQKYCLSFVFKPYLTTPYSRNEVSVANSAILLVLPFAKCSRCVTGAIVLRQSHCSCQVAYVGIPTSTIPRAARNNL